MYRFLINWYLLKYDSNFYNFKIRFTYKIVQFMLQGKKVIWQKLLSREGVDITTISQIDVVFYDLIRQATEKWVKYFLRF